jgi:hypothetical protein
MRADTAPALLCIAIFAAACASNPKTELGPGERSFSAHGDPHTLASCVVVEMNRAAGTDYEFIGTTENAGLHVIGRAAGSDSNQPVFDLSFKTGEKDAVTVILKTRASGYGGPDYPDYLVTSLSNCGITG